MTETPDTRLVCEVPRTKAATAACSECPWLASNANREHSGDQYSDVNFTRVWRNIAKEGLFLGCHIFDAGLHPVTEADVELGYKPTVDIGARKECAGSLAMVQRELEILAGYDSHDDYLEARPVGLSVKALAMLKERWEGRQEPELRFNPNPDYSNITDPMERIDTSSIEWSFSETAAVRFVHTMEAIAGDNCTCPVCENHTTIHPPEKLTTVDGKTVEVDRELHGLLSMMVKAGIRTISSCVNLADALDQLWPVRKPQIIRVPIGELNYRSMILREAAHVRINNSSPQAKAFMVAATQTPGVEVVSDGILTQFVFDTDAIPRLTRIAEVLANAFNKKRAPKRPTDRKPKKK